MRRGRSSLVLAVAALGALGLGCSFGCSKLKRALEELDDTPRVGGKCKNDEAACLDAHTELVCHGGRFEQRRCGDPRGCQVRPKGAQSEVLCYWGVDQLGEACESYEEDTSQCTQARDQRLTCKTGKIVSEWCRGPKKCTEGQRVECDISSALVGDPCSAGDSSCSVDKKSLLECRDGTYAVAHACTGKTGCSVSKGSLSCDRDTANAGESCDSNGSLCTPDHLGYVRCKGGVFAAASSCRGPNKCRVHDGLVDCDARVAEVDDPCDDDGGACSSDRSKFLTCQHGRFRAKTECACGFDDTTVGCGVGEKPKR